MFFHLPQFVLPIPDQQMTTCLHAHVKELISHVLSGIPERDSPWSTRETWCSCTSVALTSPAAEAVSETRYASSMSSKLKCKLALPTEFNEYGLERKRARVRGLGSVLPNPQAPFEISSLEIKYYPPFHGKLDRL